MSRYYTTAEFEQLVRERVKPRPLPVPRPTSPEQQAKNDRQRQMTIAQWADPASRRRIMAGIRRRQREQPTLMPW